MSDNKNNEIVSNTDDPTSPDYRVLEEDRADDHTERDDENVANQHDEDETVSEEQVLDISTDPEDSVNVADEKAPIYKEYEKLTEDPNRRDDEGDDKE